MQEQFSAKEKYPKETTPECRLLPAFRRFYRGLLEGTPVPPAKCGIPAAPLFGLFPIKPPVLGAA